MVSSTPLAGRESRAGERGSRRLGPPASCAIGNEAWGPQDHVADLLVGPAASGSSGSIAWASHGAFSAWTCGPT